MELKTGWCHLIALIIVSIWGITFISTKVLLFEGLSPADIFFYRFALAYIGIWFFGKSRLFSKSVRDELIFVLIGITGGSAYFLTENFALDYTLASNVALLVCTAPLLTALFSRIFLKSEKIGRSLVQGSLVALLGVALVVFNGRFILQLNPLGDLLSVSAAMCWAIYTILLKKVTSRYSILFITRKVFFYGLLTILPVFIFFPLKTDTAILLQPDVIGNLLFLGVVASLLCFYFWNMVVKYLGAVQTTNYVYVVPVVTLIASYLILDEPITTIAIVGAILILAGVWWAEKKK